ncbi:MAG TPA: hypothetical protein VI731_03445 [Bacteroidia bacterium]|nr:hypothetical protein [Bacteroidia bacterium]
MKKFIPASLLCCGLFFSQCKKEELVKAYYTVAENSADAPSYSITYTSDKSGASTIAGSSEENWNSGSLLMEHGQFISLTVECTEPVYDFTLKIFTGGNLAAIEHFSNPARTKTISVKIED